MRIIIETYDYGVKYTDSYPNMNNFRSNVYEHEGYVVTSDNMIIDSKNIKAAYPEIEKLEINTLDKVLAKPEIKDLWDRGTVMIYLDGRVVFRIQNNYHVSVDKIQLLDTEQEEFTDEIHKYVAINIQKLEDLLIIHIIKKEN